MREPYGEGVASHPGPESCGVAREGEAEALTGGSAGEPLSREIPTSTVPTPLASSRLLTTPVQRLCHLARNRLRSSSTASAVSA